MFEWSLDLRGLQRKTPEQGECCCILCEIFISKLKSSVSGVSEVRVSQYRCEGA